VPAQAAALQEILQVFDTLHCDLSDSQIHAVIAMVVANVGRAIHAFNERLLVPETTPPPPDPAWPVHRLAYRILERVLRLRPRAVRVDPRFVRRILCQIGSAVTAEREMIAWIAVTCTELDLVPTRAMLAMLEDALSEWGNSVNEMFAIHAVLVFFTGILKSHGKVLPEVRRFFDRVVLQTAASPRFGFFEPMFSEIVRFMRIMYDDVTLKTLRVLVRHCPFYAPVKQVACFTAMSPLVAAVGPRTALLEGVGPAIVAALESGNQRAVVCAVEILSLGGFKELLSRPEGVSLLTMVLPAARNAACRHWSSEVRKRVEAFLVRYSAVTLEDGDGRPDARMQKWAVVAGEAVARDQGEELREREFY
jgi:hypothetical protein